MHLKASKELYASLIAVGPDFAGFSSAEKAVVQEQCCQLGVKYSGELVAGFTTHLLCRNILTAVNTIKYTKALQWGVQVLEKTS